MSGNRTLMVWAVVGWTGFAALAGWTLARRTYEGRAVARAMATPSPFVGPTLAAPAPGQPVKAVSLVGVNTAEKLMGQLAATLALPVHPHWEHLDIRPDTPVRFDLPSADLATVFRLWNSQRTGLNSPLDIRVFSDHAEVATTDYFDRQEVTSQNYDLTDLVRSLQAAADPTSPPTADQVVRGIIDTIQANIAMDSWTDNGGELCRTSLIGSGLLVSAPARVHPQISWVLDQMARTPGWTTGIQRLLGPSGGAVKSAAATPGTPANKPAGTGPAPSGPASIP